MIVFLQCIIHHHFLFCQCSHVFASMAVAQNTDVHPLVGRDFLKFSYIYVIYIPNSHGVLPNLEISIFLLLG